MTNQLRNATITQNDISIEALIFDNGDIYDILECSDADLLPRHVRTVDDCLLCGFMVMER